ncbi:MAG: hypothetical protein V4760_18740 [Bdellovibrionota bacterium]
MTIDRRTMLQFLALGLAGCASRSVTPEFGAVPASGKRPKGRVFFSLAKSKSASTLRVTDWDGGNAIDYDVPIVTPHSLLQDPRTPDVVYLVEAFGSCARIDLKTGAHVKVDHAHGKELFNGHAILTRAGDKLICSQFETESKAVIMVRDSVTLAKLAVLPDECSQAHHLVSLPGSSVFACGNLNGETGAITFFDYEKMKVIRRVACEKPILHLVPISATEALGVSRPQTFKKGGSRLLSRAKSSAENIDSFMKSTVSGIGPVFYAKSDGAKKIFWDESKKERFRGGFGLAPLDGDKVFLSGHTEGNSVFLWRDGVIERVFDVPTPINIVVSGDASEFMVMSESEPRITVFSLRTYEKSRVIEFETSLRLFGKYQGVYA